MGQRILGPQLDHEAVGVDELRGDDVDGAFEIENDARGAVIDLGEANLLEAMITNLDGLGSVMGGSGRAEAIEVEVEARGVFDLIGGELIGALGLDGDAGDIAEGPETDGFDVRIDAGERLSLCQATEEC
jgi:hypothetical protein